MTGAVLIGTNNAASNTAKKAAVIQKPAAMHVKLAALFAAAWLVSLAQQPALSLAAVYIRSRKPPKFDETAKKTYSQSKFLTNCSAGLDL